jgi:hypothetical protein
MRFGSHLFVWAAVLVVVAGGTFSEAETMRAPKAVIARRSHVLAKTGDASPLRLAVHFFRTTISPVDGNRCPMYPTCSQYGEEAIGRHGPVLGLLLIVDRLFHEWTETARAPRLWVHGVLRSWDPLEANDFWFSTNTLPEDAGVKEPP